MYISRSFFIAIWLIPFCSASISYAVVSPKSKGVIYQYPVAGSHEVPPSTGIGIRAASAYDAESLSEGSFVAIGNVSGAHVLTVRLSRDRRTAVFHTATPFDYHEIVSFAMNAKLAGGASVSDTFSFATMVRAPMKTIPDWVRNGVQRYNPLGNSTDSLFPVMTVTVDSGATPGTIYMGNEGFTFIPNNFYIFTLDEHGNVTRQQWLPNDYSQDFKLQPNGVETYFDENANVYQALDSGWNILDPYQAESYPANDHELRVFPDGSYALLAVSQTTADTRSFVIGGSDSAVVYGGVIEMFDPDGLCIFTWRGIDNFQIQDATFEDLTNPVIDFEHANSLDFDSSGNIILSSRHLCEITKISSETGDIIWRLGGHHNQFKLLDDSIWFSYQHAARLLPNDHLILMDNANFDTVSAGFDTVAGADGKFIEQSRPVEYELDTTVMTARLVWQYHHTPETFTYAMGYVERLPNGNTFIGWGADTLAITEIRPDKSTAFEMNMWNGNFSYRAIKYPTDTAVLSVPIAVNQSVSTSLSILQNPETNITDAIVTLTEPAFASLDIYDLLGRHAISLNDNILGVGSHTFPIDATALAFGSYYCVLHVEGGQVITKPVEIIK